MIVPINCVSRSLRVLESETGHDDSQMEMKINNSYLGVIEVGTLISISVNLNGYGYFLVPSKLGPYL